MRVVIAGAGSVGKFIAEQLHGGGHEVQLVDNDASVVKRAIASGEPAGVEWLHADACEVGALAEAGVGKADVVVAVTGDDEDNLVISLLAKQEFGVPRVVARVNNPKNEWMFDEAWGVDVAVSTPRLMTALVEEAVSIGDLVRIFTFHQSHANMVELTLPPDAPIVGTRVGDIEWPPDTVLVCIIRAEQPIAPSRDDTLEGNDELMFITMPDSEDQLQALLSPTRESPAPTT